MPGTNDVWGDSAFWRDILFVKPTDGRGVPLGVDDWRLAVEILTTPPADTVGTARVGTARARSTTPGPNGYQWADLTPYVAGIAISRGADHPRARPNIGTAQITLDSSGNRFHPLLATFATDIAQQFGPGAPMRICAYSPTSTTNALWGTGAFELDQKRPENGLYPLMVGDVAAWNVETNYNAQLVHVDLVEPLARFAGLDEPARPPITGDWAFTRRSTLVDGRWSVEPGADAGIAYVGVQATTLAGDRLTEMFLTSDSCGNNIVTTRLGQIGFCRYLGYKSGASRTQMPVRGITAGADWLHFSTGGTAPAGSFSTPIDRDTLTITTDPFGIYQACSFAGVGGTAQTATTPTPARQAARAYRRNDLITLTGGPAPMALAEYYLRLNPPRVRAVSVAVTGADTARRRALLALDIANKASVEMPDGSTLLTAICGYDMTIQTTGPAHPPDWQARVRFGRIPAYVNNTLED